MILLIILKILFWRRCRSTYATISSSRVSQFTFLAYCGIRRTTWDHLHKLFSKTRMIECLGVLNAACIHNMDHVWKPHNKLTYLTAFEHDQNYVTISQLFWSAIILLLTFMVLIAMCVAQCDAFHFTSSSKSLLWCIESESSLHGKCSSLCQHSTCASLHSPLDKYLTFHGKEINLCSKQSSFLLRHLISMLLIISGDIEINPGPKQGMPFYNDTCILT